MELALFILIVCLLIAVLTALASLLGHSLGTTKGMSDGARLERDMLLDAVKHADKDHQLFPARQTNRK